MKKNLKELQKLIKDDETKKISEINLKVSALETKFKLKHKSI